MSFPHPFMIFVQPNNIIDLQHVFEYSLLFQVDSKACLSGLC